MVIDQPYSPQILYRFKYNIETRVVEQNDALVKAYDMEQFYYNMPYGFSDTNVIEEDREAYNNMYRRLDAGENYSTADFRVTSDRHWARVVLYRESVDSPIFQGIVQDVSERYEWIIKQEEQRKAEQLRLRSKEFEALQLLRAISDTYDMIVSVNLTKNHYFYYSYEHFINNEVEEGVFDEVINYHASYVSDEHREMYLNTFSRKALIQAYEEGKKEVYLEYQQADDFGVYHWLATHTMFVENPYSNDIMEITISQNIDERVRKEKGQQQLIKDALELAKKANNAKTDFLSRMSHDIRTPMNAIIGMTTIGLANSGNKDKVEECFGKIDISSKFLLTLINDILDLSKIESGKMDVSKEVFSVSNMLKSLENSATTLANNKSQTFHCRVDENVSEFYKGDALRLERILMNLLSNACKFTPENGEIGLSIELERRDEDKDILQMVVEDNGIGISEDFIDRLFEPFEQNVDAGKCKGSGLGLAIVRNLVHLMDGTVSVESKLGEGSRFIIEIPLYLPDEEQLGLKSQADNSCVENASTKPSKERFHGERILVVEDNELNQEVAKTIFEMHNLKVDIACDGFEAMEKFLSSKPGYYCTIFMDIQMPGMNGYDTTKQIRNSTHADGKTIPIYAMTADAFETDIRTAKHYGMNGHIAKPVDFAVAEQILLKHIKKDITE